MKTNYFTPDTERGTYERIVDTLAAQMGLTPDQFKASYKIMPATLKMAQPLNTGLSQYSFSPRKGVDPAVPNTVLLDQNDFFAVDSVGLRIGRAAFASNTYSNHGNYPLLTYADPAYFSGNGTTAGSEASSLQCLVNGTLGINVNNDAMLDPTLAQEFFFNPDGKYVASPLSYPRFGGSDGERGLKTITPQLILDASADNSFAVTLANGAKGNIDGSISTGTTDSGVRNFLYVIAQGWKVKNLSGTRGVACAKV